MITNEGVTAEPRHTRSVHSVMNVVQVLTDTATAKISPHITMDVAGELATGSRCRVYAAGHFENEVTKVKCRADPLISVSSHVQVCYNPHNECE
jgi:hypothetical protein